MPRPIESDDDDGAELAALDVAEPEHLRQYFEERSAEYARASWARSTLKSYASQFGLFAAWAKRCGYPSLPTTAAALAAFVVHESERTTTRGQLRRTAGIRQALAAIRFTHVMNGQRAPIDDPYVQSVLRGRARLVRALPVDRAEAVTVTDLLTILGRLDHHNPEDVHDRALLALGFSGALRRSELQNLDWSSVAASDSAVTLAIRGPKGAPGRVDCVVCPAATRHQVLCPVAAMRGWARWGAVGSVFRRFSAGVAGAELRDADVGAALLRRARSAGISAAFTAHSLRNGWATSAAEAGVPLAAIQLHLRHLDASTTTRYVQASSWAHHPGAGLY